LKINVKGAREHNLKGVDVEIGDSLTVVTGVSGSGKTSLVFDTIYLESHHRFQEIFVFGSPTQKLAPARIDSITGLSPSVAVDQNHLNRDRNSTRARE
jgi:excinuclease ABC subunit A